jgi:Uma2 family endonuclease
MIFPSAPGGLSSERCAPPSVRTLHNTREEATLMSSVPTPRPHRLSHDEYFALEQREDRRYEYCAGEVFAMAGGSESHALISANVLVGLANALREKPCRVYGADMKLYIREHDHFCYPDVQVLCERGIRHDRYVENPVLLVEVLSPSTESYDRGGKFEHYRTIGALEYYLLIDQQRRHVELFERESGNVWRFTEHGDAEGRVPFPKLDAVLELEDIYGQVEFGRAFETGVDGPDGRA